MENWAFSIERSAIRFAIDGSWTCEEFSEFLRMTDDVYKRINSVFVLSIAIGNEIRLNDAYHEQKDYDRIDYSWENQYFGSFYDHPMGVIALGSPTSYSRLIELTESVREPLQIDAISYSSPGWIQMIGDWNPLKILADFVTKWRAENTKREANRSNAANKRLRIQADLAAKIIETAPKMKRRYEGGPSRLIDLAENVIHPTSKYLENIGANSRVLDVQIVSPDQPLPPSRRKRRKA